ncbi:MAG: hypothetical protein Kow0027_04990 [Saprospiraceae bacterium]
MRHLLLFSLLGCFSFSLTSQNLSPWHFTVREVRLLKNAGEVLPLRSLTEPVFWHSDESVFSRTLAKYQLPEEEMAQAKRLILSCNCNEPATVSGLRSELKNIAEEKQVVLALFGPCQPSEIETFVAQSDALLYSSAGDALHQSIAAQIIYGAIGAIATMQKSPGPAGSRQESLRTAPIHRLGYLPPEAAGMNGRLLEDSIKAIVEEGIRAGAYPGAQVLVARKGLVVYHKAFGYMTYDSLQPLSTEAIYDLASVTKVSSTLPALMKLYGEGKLDLDAPLSQYFDFLNHSNKKDLTLRQIMAHYGRLKPSVVFWKKAQRKNGKWRWGTFKPRQTRRFSVRITDSLFVNPRYHRRMYKTIARLPLEDSLRYLYSDLPFVITPLLVERLTGQPLEEYLKATFYRPLGAATITYNPLRFFPKERIVPTERDTFFRRQQVHGTVHDENAAILGGVSGHAGLFASANDLAKLFQMYLNGGEYGGHRYIAEMAVREFTRCQYCEEGNRRGLGFDKPPLEYEEGSSYIARSASKASFGHSGYTGTFVWADPESELLVIFLSNRVYLDRSRRALYTRNIRPRLHQACYDAIGVEE